MKTCSNCHAQIEDDALFCMNCGTKIESTLIEEKTKFCTSCSAKIPAEAKFCPECSAKQDTEEPPSQKKFNSPISRRNLVLKGSVTACRQPNEELKNMGFQFGELRLYNDQAYFTTENTNFLLKMQTMGRNSKFGIYYRNIIGINLNQYELLVIENNGAAYFFGGHGFTKSSCKADVLKMAYMMELYRRLYWMCDENGDGTYPSLTTNMDKNVVDFNNVSMSDLITLYNQL